MTWRKSSFSGTGGDDNCVEVVFSQTQVGVRDSKLAGQAISVSPAGWLAFLARTAPDRRLP